MNPELFKSIAQTLALVFSCREEEINHLTCSADIPNWDSLNNIKMLIAIEKKFNVKFKGVEVSSLENVGELLELVQKKLMNK